VALGSNIEPEQYLPEAVDRLQQYGDILAVSAVYESPPVDGSEQPNYLNAALLLATSLTAEQLCREALPAIEHDLGRVRDPSNRYASRTIDLDLALYDTSVLQIDHRHVPDPEIADRAFLAIPLAELDPSYVVPGIGISLQQLAKPHRGAGSLSHRPDVELRSAMRNASRSAHD